MKRARYYSQPYSTRSEPTFWKQCIPRRAINAQPERISFRSEATYPNKRQYPMKLETKKGLQLLIHKSLQHGLSAHASLHAILLFFQVLNQLGKVERHKTSEQGWHCGPYSPLVANTYKTSAQPLRRLAGLLCSTSRLLFLYPSLSPLTTV